MNSTPAAPRLLTATETYSVRLAASQAEIRAAQVLRFNVFNLELNEGLESSYVTRTDVDDFDACCDHLIVEHVATGEIVGTYRMQTGTMAARGLGFYSAGEFDMTPYDKLRGEIVELGRACVAQAHRNLIVLGLLWKGVVEYAVNRG